MVNKKTVLKILEMHYIEQMTFTEIAESPKIKYTRQTVAKVCNHYKAVVPEYLNTYYNGDLNKFYRKYKYVRDGSGNVKLNAKNKESIVMIIKIITDGEVTPQAYPPSGKRYKITYIVNYLKMHGYYNFSESTLRRFIRKKYKRYFDKPIKPENRSDQNDNEQKE